MSSEYWHPEYASCTTCHRWMHGVLKPASLKDKPVREICATCAGVKPKDKPEGEANQ